MNFRGGSFMKRTKWILAVLIVALAFFGCSDSDDDNGGEEFNEEAFYVTDQVIEETANAAYISFLATPDIPLFAQEIQNARGNGFTWSVGDLADKTGSTTAYISGKSNQLAAEGSGFQFTLITSAANTDALRPAIGFGAIFNFTSDNLGIATYNSLRTALEGLEEIGEGWVAADASVLAGFGIGVFTMYQGATLNITDRISAGMKLEDDSIMIYYGVVMVDRNISDIDEEGVSLLVSEGEERIWSDGTLDGKITCGWWIGKTTP
jgi:hypothetical protein